MLHKIQQFVQLGIIAAFEQTAVGNHGGGAVHQGRTQQGCAVLQMVPGFDYLVKTLRQFVPQRLGLRGITAVRACDQGVMDLGQGGEAVAQGNEIDAGRRD